MSTTRVEQHTHPVFGVPQSSSSRLGELHALIAKYDVLQQRILQQRSFTVLEVGSYEGSSAIALSSCIAELGARGHITCVDPWLPYLPEEDIATNDVCSRMQQDLQSGITYARFIHNIKFAHPNVPISHFRGTLHEMLHVTADPGTFDLIYIDGSHVYKDVKRDLDNAWPLLNVGGIMCGDDLEHQFTAHEERVVAVADREYVDGYHPGVTLAVGRRFGYVWSRGGVWAVKKTGESSWEQP